MATLGTTYLNLIDQMKKGENGLYEIVEALHQLSPFMRDANVITCNSGTKHKHAIRTGLPSVSWGALYQGTPQSKSQMTEVEDTTGFVEGLSSVDTRLLKLYGEKARLMRQSEGRSFLESIAIEVESSIWYSDVRVNGKKFHGLSPRYNTLANPCVVGGGGSGSDNTSIWMVTHGDGQTSILTPEGIPAGITQEDKGEQRVLDAANNPYYVLEEKFEQHVGIAVKDWRYTGRIANIDVSDAIAGNVDIYRLLTSLFYKLQGRRHYKFDSAGQPMQGRTVIYMNRTMLEVLDNLATNRPAGGTGLNSVLRLNRMEIQGEEVLTWRGMPIRETDALLNTEAAIA
jgi:hypothetical protein